MVISLHFQFVSLITDYAMVRRPIVYCLYVIRLIAIDSIHLTCLINIDFVDWAKNCPEVPDPQSNFIPQLGHYPNDPSHSYVPRIPSYDEAERQKDNNVQVSLKFRHKLNLIALILSCL